MATPVPHPDPIVHLVTCGTCYSRHVATPSAHPAVSSDNPPNSPYPSFHPDDLNDLDEQDEQDPQGL